MITRSFRTASPAPEAAFDPSELPSVSIVIVTFGTGPIVTRTLTSVASTTSGVEVDVIVVDNPHPAQTDRTEAELRLFTSGVTVLTPERNLGFGGGCELGALHARGDHLAFVNPDVTFPEGWLPLLLDAVADPGVSIAAPVLLDPDGSVQEAGQRILPDGSTVPIRTRPAAVGPVDVDYSSAACWVMRRDEHERLGGFDPAYHPAYFEDVDLALRAHSLGGRTVVDGRVAVVHHRGEGTPDRPAPAIAQREVLRATWGLHG